MLKIAPDCAGLLVRQGLLTLWIVSCVACGGNDTPPGCDCPWADTLTADRITREVFDYSAYNGEVVDCSGEDQLLFGASCFVKDALENYVMNSNGYFEHRQQGEPGWTCTWDNFTAQRRDYRTTTLCLEPADPADSALPPGCGCEEVEPLDMRFVRDVQTEALPSGELVRVSASCQEEGHVTIGGGCTVKDNDAWPADDWQAHLVGTGFSPDGSEWHCDWQITSSRDLIGAAAALCVAPPSDDTAPEEVPLSERIVRVEREVNLLQGGIFRLESECEEGDTLIRGSCTVDPLELARDVQLLVSAFPEDTLTRPNAWLCEWWVPLGVTQVKGTATALCLKPLEEPAP